MTHALDFVYMSSASYLQQICVPLLSRFFACHHLCDSCFVIVVLQFVGGFTPVNYSVWLFLHLLHDGESVATFPLQNNILAHRQREELLGSSKKER